jgi:hypothetical protein
MDVSEDTGELVQVLETRNQGMIATIKSLLEGAGIEYAIKNEFGHSVWPAEGVQIWVRPEDADGARAIVSDFEVAGEISDVEPAPEYQPTEIEADTPSDLSQIPPPQPEQPFIIRALWVIGALLIPLVLVIIYSMRN